MSTFESPIMRDIAKLVPYVLLGIFISIGIFVVIPITLTIDLDMVVEKFPKMIFSFDLLIVQIFWIINGLSLCVLMIGIVPKLRRKKEMKIE